MAYSLHTGVVGLGRIGWQFHCPELMRHEGFDLVAAVDPLAERREEAETTYGCRTYSDVASMLASESLDLMVIASPTNYHVDHAIAAFEHGIDVFCDKPMAPTLAEAERMVRAAKAAGRKLMVYQPHRAGVDVVSLRAVLARDLIGSVYMIKRASSMYVRRNDWQAFREHGGGMLNNYGAITWINCCISRSHLPNA